MPTPIEENATRVLQALAAFPRSEGSIGHLTGPQLAEVTGLSSEDINDAVSVLVESGLAEWRRYYMTAPFVFGLVHLTSRGRLEAQRLTQEAARDIAPDSTRRLDPGERSVQGPRSSIVIPPTPQGSPFGFDDQDWEIVTARKSDSETLQVVMGFQFSSEHYTAEALKRNVNEMFTKAVGGYLQLAGALPTRLHFRALAAGYGEHLFNEIARDIISSDVAVFDTSDLNPNVMLEMGVALTWGVRVLPIKKEGCPRPPSDLSGQTWADYVESAARFVDPEHEPKLVRLVERAIRKKARGNRA